MPVEDFMFYDYLKAKERKYVTEINNLLRPYYEA